LTMFTFLKNILIVKFILNKYIHFYNIMYQDGCKNAEQNQIQFCSWSREHENYFGDQDK